MKPNRLPVALSLRLYRALARAFPYEFKNAYGKELLEVTEQTIEFTWRRYGVFGLTRLLFDIAIRIPVEHFSELRRDIRYGLRGLAKSRGFTAVALISLSIGLCIAACAYSELHGLILRDVPGVLRPNQLVAAEMPISYPAHKRFRGRSDLFSSTAVYVAPVPFEISLNGYTERTWGHLVSPSYFSTLGIHPALGRFFEDERQQRRQPPQIVLSYRFWRDHLASDPSIIGKTLRVDGHSCIVLGIGPKGFLGASPALFVADLWMPLSAGERIAPELAGNALQRWNVTMFHFLGRLRPGISITRAEAALDTLAREMRRDYAGREQSRKRQPIRLLPGGKVLPIPKQQRPFFTEFFIVLGGMVLLIACANLANMALARAVNRRKEIAVRLSLGAGRARILRQLLTESMLIALPAGMIGFGLSIIIMGAASQLRMPYPMPVSFNLNPDWRAFLFTLGLTLLAGIILGLASAWQAMQTELTPALKEGSVPRPRRFRRFRMRNLLMFSQVTGSLALLLLTGFLVLGSQTNLSGKAGFNPANLYLVSLDPLRDGYPAGQIADLLKHILTRVRHLPSVRTACLTDTVPLAVGGNPGVRFSTEEHGSRIMHHAEKYVVGKGYFETTGIPILQGHEFRKQDRSRRSMAAIVSEALVKKYWSGEDPIGRRIEVTNGNIEPVQGMSPGTIDYRAEITKRQPQVFRVVGVAQDIQQGFASEKPRPAIYFPLRASDYARPSVRGVTLIVRAAPGADVLRTVRHEISGMDARLTTFDARSMVEQIGETLSIVRVAAWTYGFIGLCGLILASVGLAGVAAYTVAQRTREIGIRMALGAQGRDVLRLVMKESVTLVLLGTAAGLVFGWAMTRFLLSVFPSVADATAAVVYGRTLVVGAPLLFMVIALAACYLPARKSVHIDPLSALRQE